MDCTLATLLLPWITLASNSTTVVSIPLTEWEDAAGVTAGRGWGEVRGRNGLIQAVPAFQLTNHGDKFITAYDELKRYFDDVTVDGVPFLAFAQRRNSRSATRNNIEYVISWAQKFKYRTPPA